MRVVCASRRPGHCGQRRPSGRQTPLFEAMALPDTELPRISAFGGQGRDHCACLVLAVAEPAIPGAGQRRLQSRLASGSESESRLEESWVPRRPLGCLIFGLAEPWRLSCSNPAPAPRLASPCSVSGEFMPRPVSGRLCLYSCIYPISMAAVVQSSHLPHQSFCQANPALAPHMRCACAATTVSQRRCSMCR